MRYPAFIREGDTIGFAAPSFGCNIEPYRTAFDHALEMFRNRGFKTQCGPNVYAGDGIGISSAPENCGKEFTQMYLSAENDMILSCGGGELMCEILDFVDFEAIKKAPPKWFMGYSDNTNLTFLLATLCDTASVYGPCAPSFGMEPLHPALTDALDLLQGKKLVTKGYNRYETESLKDEKHPLEPYNCTEKRKIIPFLNAVPASSGKVPGERSGTAPQIRFSGRLIGGCLDCLVNLCGTKYDKTIQFAERYKGDGLIWFIEACDLNVYGIRRAIWEMQHAGWFSHVSGFLIGRPYSGREKLFGLDHVHAVTDLLAQYNVPILLDVDLGHLPPMMPVITGSMTEVSYCPKNGRFRLEMRTE